jgi:hypothetical protein
MQPASTKQPPGSGASGTNPPEPPRPIPGRIGGVLHVIRTLIAYGRYLTAAAPARAARPEFAPAAALFGTYDVATILFRVQRGIRRAMALQRYLLARAARGRNLRFVWAPTTEPQPHHRPPPAPPRAKPAAPRRAPGREPALLDDSDPRAFYLPTDEELDAEVRRRPVGLTMTYICLDLSVYPCLSESAFFDQWMGVIRRYGGNLGPLFDVRARRQKAFQRERDRRPETWHIPWQAVGLPAIRQAPGLLIGEPPPSPGLPAIVPS